MEKCKFQPVAVYYDLADLDWDDVTKFVLESKIHGEFFGVFQRQFVARSISETISWAKWYLEFQLRSGLRDFLSEDGAYAFLTFSECECGCKAANIHLASKSQEGSTAYGVKFCKASEEYFLCLE